MNISTMKSFEEELDSLKARLIDKAIIGAGLFFTPAYIASILRYFHVGWHPIYALHTIILLTFILVTIRRKKLSYQFKTHIFCMMLMTISVASTLFFQTAGDKILAFISVLLAVIIFGARIGIMYSIALLLIYIVLFILHKTEVLVVSVDLNTYSNDTLTWILYFSTTILYLGILIFITAEYYRLFTSSIKNLIASTFNLKESKKQLEYSEERFKQLSNLTDEGILIHQCGSVFRCKQTVL